MIMVSDLAKQIYQELTASEPKAGLPAIPDVDAQLEAWKKMPKEQAVKELLQFLEIKKPKIQDDKDTYLSGLKLLAEITGAITPTQNTGQNIVAIKINMPDPIAKNIIEIDNGK